MTVTSEYYQSIHMNFSPCSDWIQEMWGKGKLREVNIEGSQVLRTYNLPIPTCFWYFFIPFLHSVKKVNISTGKFFTIILLMNTFFITSMTIITTNADLQELSSMCWMIYRGWWTVSKYGLPWTLASEAWLLDKWFKTGKPGFLKNERTFD